MARRTPTDSRTAPGPEKTPMCNGGGILGLISVEVLARLEAELRDASGNPQRLPGDWFDFVCGTSTDSPRPVSNDPQAEYTRHAVQALHLPAQLRVTDRQGASTP